MFEDKHRCITEGKLLAEAILARTDRLADALSIIQETEQWRVMYVQQTEACRPLDLMHYQNRLDEYINGKPTLVLTQDEQVLSSGLYNVGLRRAGDNLDVSKVAAIFKQHPPIASGGGHAFAGGVQSHHSLTQEAVKEMAITAMMQLFP